MTILTLKFVILWAGSFVLVKCSWIRIRIGSGFNQISGSGSGFGIRIQKGKNDPQKYKKSRNFML